MARSSVSTAIWKSQTANLLEQVLRKQSKTDKPTTRPKKSDQRPTKKSKMRMMALSVEDLNWSKCSIKTISQFLRRSSQKTTTTHLKSSTRAIVRNSPLRKMRSRLKRRGEHSTRIALIISLSTTPMTSSSSPKEVCPSLRASCPSTARLKHSRSSLKPQSLTSSPHSRPK